MAITWLLSGNVQEKHCSDVRVQKRSFILQVMMQVTRLVILLFF